MSTSVIKRRNVENNQWICGNGHVKGRADGRPVPASVHLCVVGEQQVQKLHHKVACFLNTGCIYLVNYKI